MSINDAQAQKRRASIAKTAREHWIEDNEILVFFQKFVSNTPEELRDMLSDPAFNAGFVVALIYAKSRAGGGAGRVNKGETATLQNIIEAVIEHTKNTPFVSKN